MLSLGIVSIEPDFAWPEEGAKIYEEVKSQRRVKSLGLPDGVGGKIGLDPGVASD